MAREHGHGLQFPRKHLATAAAAEDGSPALLGHAPGSEHLGEHERNSDYEGHDAGKHGKATLVVANSRDRGGDSTREPAHKAE